MVTASKSWGIIAAALFLLTIATTATAKYAGGSGTADDPYLIATAEDLIALGDDPNDYNKHFLLTADIDLGGHVFDKAVIPSEPPLGGGTPFTGGFDGSGHKISHLTIEGEAYLGLFGQLGSGAEVKNLGLVDVNITGSGWFVGALVGYNGELWQGGATITGCYSTGTVSGRSSVGGLVGSNRDGTISNCHSNGSVSGDGGVGGLVGGNCAAISNCYSTGSVSGTGYGVGGLVADNSGSISNCHSTGSVSGTGNSVGGLVGRNDDWPGGIISNCYSTGSVGGQNEVGGLVGTNSGGAVTQCYSTGGLTGKDNVGGLVGYNWGIVTYCYASGSASGLSCVGGLIGQISGIVHGGSVSGPVVFVGHCGCLLQHHLR